MPRGKTRTTVRLIFGLALLAAMLPSPPQIALANHVQPALDPSQLDYDPIGYYGPADEAGTLVGESATIPATPPNGAPPAVPGPNPSGKFIAYDTNVWESLHLPMRHPGDNCNSLPVEERHPDCRAGDLDADNDGPQGYSGPGGISTVHGVCPPSPGFMSGECFNSQLEYLDYYEQAMETLLAPFGGVVHRYGFQSPGGGLVDGQPRGSLFAASGGQAYNIAAVVPGADHPEETVLVSGHYDFTDSGPAAAWDSAEGHTEVMRMAYIMADYWKKTGTRPSATVKFVPWDSEESGTWGSIDYVNNNIPPLPNGQPDASLVRAYFNVDPCAGAYPAFKDGNFTERIPEVMQLAAPVNARISAFNAKAEIIIDQVFDRLDDTITTPTGEQPIFVSNSEATPQVPSQRGEIITNTSGLGLFSSDYRNFEGIGVPIFNLFPDMLGPHGDDSDEEAAGRDTTGISILHTPNDNLTRINRLTSGLNQTVSVPAVDPTGLFASEGWAKGMEFCAQANAQYMLQPEMAGAQTSSTAVVAYYEALPNEALQNQNVTFDASETYQYADPTTQALVPQSELTYTWDFGDGTTGTGRVVEHAYANIGRYTTRLTVTGRGGSMDSMTVPVNIIGSNFVGPVLDAIPPADARDGTFALNWDFTATRDGFSHFRIDESKNILRLFSEDAEAAPTVKWVVSVAPASSTTQPWQESDSATLKFRTDNPHRSGAQSYWTGVSPQDFNPGPANVNSILTMKTPVTIPTIIGGDPELSFFSLFQSEGDDQGRVEIAQVDTLGNVGEFQAIDVQQAVNVAVGQEDPLVCDPSRPDEVLAQGFTARRISLAPYEGKTVLIRFVYFLGAENRVLSQPCGWFIDDIQMTTGTWSPIGTSTTETFQVTGRKNGQFGYRVLGVYTDNVSTAPSNAEIVFVCRPTSRRMSIPC
jgi:PKD repeat protein/Zn-dependent M28 family amino/carboxypeptidase